VKLKAKITEKGTKPGDAGQPTPEPIPVGNNQNGPKHEEEST
jgi:hypothetical protein